MPGLKAEYRQWGQVIQKYRASFAPAKVVSPLVAGLIL